MIDQVTLSHFGQVGLKQNTQLLTLEMCMQAVERKGNCMYGCMVSYTHKCVFIVKLCSCCVCECKDCLLLKRISHIYWASSGNGLYMES